MTSPKKAPLALRLELEARAIDENYCGPDAVDIDITEKDARRILQLRKAVEDLDVEFIADRIGIDQEPAYLVEDTENWEENKYCVWDKETEYHKIFVRKTQIWYSCCPRNVNVQIESDSFDIAIIEQYLEILEASTEELPLMINRDWGCDGLEAVLKERLENVKAPQKST